MPQLEHFKPSASLIPAKIEDVRMQREQLRNLKGRNALLEQAQGDYEEDRNWLREERGWKREDRGRAVKEHRFKDETDALDYMYKSVPMITYDNYQQAKEHFEELGLAPGLLPDIASFGPPGSPQARQALDKFMAESMEELRTLRSRGTTKEKKGWSDPYKRKDGTWVQKNMDTNEIRKVPQKETPQARRPSQVKKDIVSLEKARQELISTGALNAATFSMLAMTNPDMAETIKGVDPSRAVDAIDDAIEELLMELPEGSRKSSKSKSTTPSWKDFRKTK